MLPTSHAFAQFAKQPAAIMAFSRNAQAYAALGRSANFQALALNPSFSAALRSPGFAEAVRAQ